MKYTIRNAQDIIHNIIVWNGEGDYPLPDGYTIAPWQEGDAIPVVTVPVILSASQFNYMLALIGLDDVVDGVRLYLKQAGHPMYPVIHGHMAGQNFHLDKTLAIVAEMRPIILGDEGLFPDADISDATITAAWEIAAAWNI